MSKVKLPCGSFKNIPTTRVNISLNVNNVTSCCRLHVVCSSNMTGYQCRCEQSFAWSFNNCITHGACDAIVGDTCGCINALPADGRYCQPNTSQTGTANRAAVSLITHQQTLRCASAQKQTSVNVH